MAKAQIGGNSMKKLFWRIRKLTVFMLMLVVIFTITLIVLGAICNVDRIISIYKEFYGTWSWNMIVCLVLSGVTSGICVTYLIAKKTHKKSEDD